MGDAHEEGDHLATRREQKVAGDAARELAARRAFRAGERRASEEGRRPATQSLVAYHRGGSIVRLAVSDGAATARIGGEGSPCAGSPSASGRSAMPCAADQAARSSRARVTYRALRSLLRWRPSSGAKSAKTTLLGW